LSDSKIFKDTAHRAASLQQLTSQACVFCLRPAMRVCYCYQCCQRWLSETTRQRTKIPRLDQKIQRCIVENI